MIFYLKQYVSVLHDYSLFYFKSECKVLSAQIQSTSWYGKKKIFVFPSFMIKLFNLKKSLIIYIWLPSKCAAFRACAYLDHKAVIYFYSVKHFNLFKTYLQVVFLLTTFMTNPHTVLLYLNIYRKLKFHQTLQSRAEVSRSK